MSLLQSAPRLVGFGHSTTSSDHAKPGSADGKGVQTDPKQLRSTSSIANLIDFVRNPSQNVNAALESWYDGMTKEERDRRQSLADRKQLLYVKMRMVWHGTASLLPARQDVIIFLLCRFTDEGYVNRLRVMSTGKRPQRSWMMSRAITSGRPYSTPPTTMHSWSSLAWRSWMMRGSVAILNGCYSSYGRP